MKCSSIPAESNEKKKKLLVAIRPGGHSISHLKFHKVIPEVATFLTTAGWKGKVSVAKKKKTQTTTKKRASPKKLLEKEALPEEIKRARVNVPAEMFSSEE